MMTQTDLPHLTKTANAIAEIVDFWFEQGMDLGLDDFDRLHFETSKALAIMYEIEQHAWDTGSPQVSLRFIEAQARLQSCVYALDDIS